MARKSLVWVDVGMAVAIGGFIAIVVFFRTEDVFVPLMAGYMAAIVIWAVVAERAAMRAEATPAVTSARTATPKAPLPH